MTATPTDHDHQDAETSAEPAPFDRDALVALFRAESAIYDALLQILCNGLWHVGHASFEDYCADLFLRVRPVVPLASATPVPEAVPSVHIDDGALVAALPAQITAFPAAPLGAGEIAHSSAECGSGAANNPQGAAGCGGQSGKSQGAGKGGRG